MGPFTDGAAFVPRGLHTGLALRTGKHMVLLERFQNDTSAVYQDDNDDIDTESIIRGTMIPILYENGIKIVQTEYLFRLYMHCNLNHLILSLCYTFS